MHEQMQKPNSHSESLKGLAKGTLLVCQATVVDSTYSRFNLIILSQQGLVHWQMAPATIAYTDRACPDFQIASFLAQ